VIRRRVDKRFLPASSSAPAGNTNTPVAAKAASVVDERFELEQVNAIYSLLDNRYKHAVCLSSPPDWAYFG
jgi:hypothetical protein